jgi:hypothetical protein
MKPDKERYAMIGKCVKKVKYRHGGECKEKVEIASFPG